MLYIKKSNINKIFFLFLKVNLTIQPVCKAALAVIDTMKQVTPRAVSCVNDTRARHKPGMTVAGNTNIFVIFIVLAILGWKKNCAKIHLSQYVCFKEFMTVVSSIPAGWK